MMIDIQSLLNKLELIQIRRQANSATNNFNIFRILRSESDEVNLHSRFLYEILSPEGSHGLGDTFLRLFATTCQLPPLNYGTVQVLREHANIDILIRDNQHAVVIENKIYAGDQHEQLKRYNAFAVNSRRHSTLCYLTLDGHEPSGWSLGDMQERVCLLSYQEHIEQWLTMCVKEAAAHPTLRETLIQYQTLIRHLTGNNMDEVEKQEVLRLVAQHDNAEKAAIIARNWKHVRWHAEWDFWNNLLNMIQLEFEIAPNKQFNADYINKVIHNRRNREFYYGLSFRIGSLGGIPVNMRLERDAEPIYYGIPYGEVKETVIRSRMKAALQPLGFNHSDYWPAWNYTNPAIDFEEYAFTNSPTMMDMLNPEKRQRILSRLFEELKHTVQTAHELLAKEFGTDFIPAAARS